MASLENAPAPLSLGAPHSLRLKSAARRRAGTASTPARPAYCHPFPASIRRRSARRPSPPRRSAAHRMAAALPVRSRFADPAWRPSASESEGRRPRSARFVSVRTWNSDSIPARTLQHCRYSRFLRQSQRRPLMPCLLVLLILAFPRIVLVVMYLTSTYLQRAYQDLIIPILGFFFLPLTTLVYAWLVNSHHPLEGVNLIRSEEHTSELQSPCNLVCRLLLGKMKERRGLRRLNDYKLPRRHLLTGM